MRKSTLHLAATAAFVSSLAFGVQDANADLVLTATSTNGGVYSNFTVTFNDSNSNGLLDLSEVVSFSGVTVFGTNLYDLLTAVPAISGFADASAGNTFNNWEFKQASGNIAESGVGVWTYSLTEANSVPEPSGLALAGTALALLAFSMRRRDRKGA
jgi:hypothetical protein